MIDEKKKMTAQGSSVGADDGQSISQTTENSIPTSGEEINDEVVNSPESLEEMYRRMQRMADPRYLHTLTMTELFQNAYMSRPPVAEGLLYAGAYILPEHPKSASPSWWPRLPTMSAPGRICGVTRSTREQCSTSRWKMIFSASRAGCL